MIVSLATAIVDMRCRRDTPSVSTSTNLGVGNATEKNTYRIFIDSMIGNSQSPHASTFFGKCDRLLPGHRLAQPVGHLHRQVLISHDGVLVATTIIEAPSGQHERHLLFRALQGA